MWPHIQHVRTNGVCYTLWQTNINQSSKGHVRENIFIVQIVDGYAQFSFLGELALVLYTHWQPLHLLTNSWPGWHLHLANCSCDVTQSHDDTTVTSFWNQVHYYIHSVSY